MQIYSSHVCRHFYLICTWRVMWSDSVQAMRKSYSPPIRPEMWCLCRQYRVLPVIIVTLVNKPEFWLGGVFSIWSSKPCKHGVNISKFGALQSRPNPCRCLLTWYQEQDETHWAEVAGCDWLRRFSSSSISLKVIPCSLNNSVNKHLTYYFDPCCNSTFLKIIDEISSWKGLPLTSALITVNMKVWVVRLIKRHLPVCVCVLGSGGGERCDGDCFSA